MRIVKCADKHVEMVDEILTHEDVWKYMTDDGSSPKEDFTYKDAIANSNNYILMVNYESVFSFFPFCYGTFFSGVASLRRCRGKEMVSYSKEIIKWMFRNTICKKIIGTTPSYNIHVKALLLRAGMKEEGRFRNAWIKNGKVFDIITFGISKEE